MKKWLFVILLLTITLPAGADVLIYTMSSKGTSFIEGSPNWQTEIENSKGYIILEEESGDDTVDMWVISTFKEKESDGKIHKKVYMESVGELEILIAGLEKKDVWIITSTDEQEQRILLTGDVKKVKIGDDIRTVASKLSGIVIWDSEENPGQRDIGCIQVTLSLHTKYTSYAREEGFDGQTATQELFDYLINDLGFEDANP